MRRYSVVLFCGVLLLAGGAVAQVDVGRIGVYGDEDASSCQIQDRAQSYVYAYVLHTDAQEANIVSFALDHDPGLNMMFLSVTLNPALLYLGNPVTGTKVSYVGCKTSFPQLLATLRWNGDGTTTECAAIRPVPNPDDTRGIVYAVDCSTNIRPLSTDPGWVNDTGDCPCTPPVPTETTTWGRIKSMYQN
jgi:hypothetical protein